MNAIKIWTLLTLVMVCGAHAQTPEAETSNPFVKDKRAKKISTARMKEEIAETIANSLERSTEIIETLPKLQREYMRMLETLMSGPKESKLTQADRIALDKTIDALALIECNLSALHKQLQDSIEVVKKQY